MKKKIVAFLVIFIVGIGIVNSKTDFFLNIERYIPQLEKYTLITQMSSDFSVKLSEITSIIPTPSEIIAYIKNEELPIDPEDVAKNAYIADSPMLSFYPDENISVQVFEDGSKLNVFGITRSPQKNYLVINFDDKNETIEQATIAVSSDGIFNKSIKIPQTDEDRLKVTIYNGHKPYGEFKSWVLNVVSLNKDETGRWSISTSPVYEKNRQLYEADKSISDALKTTPSIQSDRESIRSIATQVSAGAETEYDKAVALHDWVCSYMYYDIDNLDSPTTPPFYADEIIRTQRAVCLGFATLYASLCRSIDIPCNVVSGYALGVGADTEWTDETVDTEYQNHAWNEVYVDGRWVVVDTTWDTANKIENGEKIKGEEVSHLYFDSNLQFFSQNHKIIEYQKRS